MTTPLWTIAQALEWSFEEGGRIKFCLRVNVVADRGSGDATVPLAVFAKRLLPKLGLTNPSPPRRLVELPVFLGLWTSSIPLALPGLEGGKLGHLEKAPC